MSDFITESEQYSYPVAVKIYWSEEKDQENVGLDYYLLEPPIGNFIHLKFRAIAEKEPPNEGKCWVNSESIMTIVMV